MKDILKLENVTSGYGDLTILYDIDLKVSKEERVGILGANGAGKTTLINTILGIADIKKGRVFLDGEDVTNLPPYSRALKGIGVVPEGKRLFPKMTVFENLKVAASVTKEAKLNFEKNLDVVFSIFPRLKERLNQKSATLSGGEQQMLAVARVLMRQPKIIILDEPSQGLAPVLVDELYKALENMVNMEVTFIIAEQHVAKVLNFVNRVLVLEMGRIVFEGPSVEIKDKLIGAYVYK
ncbi:MAG: ABC transporter ATP-binding protein [Nitrososphaeria archaeon]